MYHGIVIDQQFHDPKFINQFGIFAKKQDGDWGIYGIEIEDSQLDQTISDIQQQMKADQPWYAHLYNDQDYFMI